MLPGLNPNSSFNPLSIASLLNVEPQNQPSNDNSHDRFFVNNNYLENTEHSYAVGNNNQINVSGLNNNNNEVLQVSHIGYMSFQQLFNLPLDSMTPINSSRFYVVDTLNGSFLLSSSKASAAAFFSNQVNQPIQQQLVFSQTSQVPEKKSLNNPEAETILTETSNEVDQPFPSQEEILINPTVVDTSSIGTSNALNNWTFEILKNSEKITGEKVCCHQTNTEEAFKGNKAILYVRKRCVLDVITSVNKNDSSDWTLRAKIVSNEDSDQPEEFSVLDLQTTTGVSKGHAPDKDQLNTMITFKFPPQLAGGRIDPKNKKYYSIEVVFQRKGDDIFKVVSPQFKVYSRPAEQAKKARAEKEDSSKKKSKKQKPSNSEINYHFDEYNPRLSSSNSANSSN